jgi:hypothetical protein
MGRRYEGVVGAVMLAVGSQAAGAEAAGAPVAEAPFGLAWAAKTDMPRPTLMSQEANITAMIYFRGHPPATGADTLEVVLDVCRDEGLQRVIWFSQVLSVPERMDLYEQLLANGVREHGASRPGPYPRSVIWPTGLLLGVRDSPGLGEQIVMVSEGDRFSRCSGRHHEEAGHSAVDHVAELFQPLASRPLRIRSQAPTSLPNAGQR